MSEQEPKRGELVPTQGQLLKPADPAGDLNIFQVADSAGFSWNTLDPSNPEHVFLVNEIGNEGSTTIDKWIGKQFEAQHCYINRWSMVRPEDGEYISGIRCTLISPKGEFLSFTGAGAIRCLQRLCAQSCIGLPPWNPPLVLDVGQVTEANRRRHTLQVTREELAKRIEQASHKQGKRK